MHLIAHAPHAWFLLEDADGYLFDAGHWNRCRDPVADGRVGVLETIEGRAQFRMLADATMTDAEQVDVQKALNVGQGVLNALAPAVQEPSGR